MADLFSGTSVVGRRLAERHPVTAVDVQAYSEVLGHAMLVNKPADLRYFNLEDFLSQFWNGKNLLCDVFGPYIKQEQQALVALSSGDPVPMDRLIERGSIASALQQGLPVSPHVVAALNNRSFPDPTAVVNFGGVYFSFEQSIAIDALADAIALQSESARPVLTAALLGVCSEAVNTVGKQFAQPLRLIDGHGRPKGLLIDRTLRDRSLDVVQLFQGWLSRWKESLLDHPFTNKVQRLPVEDFLRSDSGCAAFYADPPYTIDHYSRFYHVLETLTLRDRPRLATMRKQGVPTVMRGLYRQDRFQSSFCVPSKVPQAFANLFECCAASGGNLLLSYSGHVDRQTQRARCIVVNELVDIAKRYYRFVEVSEPAFEGHRKLNSSSQNAPTEASSERLISCRT